MNSPSFVVIALAVMAHVAAAQPGATQPETQAQTQVNVDAQGSTDAMLDQAIAKARASAPAIKAYAEGALRRARRAIAVGPTVGLWSAAYIDPRDVDGALSIGIGLETFDVPILPEVDSIQDAIVERAKAEAKERAEQMFHGQKPDPIVLEQLAAQAYADVRKEVLAVDKTRPKTFEEPSFTLALEADRLFAADRWLGRARVGFGVWKLTLGASASFGRACRGDGCIDTVHAFVGPEVVLHVQTSKAPRSNVVDLFTRFDVQATGRSDGMTYDQAVLGARFLVDAI